MSWKCSVRPSRPAAFVAFPAGAVSQGRRGYAQDRRAGPARHRGRGHPRRRACGRGGGSGGPGAGHPGLPGRCGRVPGCAGLAERAWRAGEDGGGGHRQLRRRAGPLPGRLRRGGGRGDAAEPAGPPAARQVRCRRRGGCRAGRPQRRGVRGAEEPRRGGGGRSGRCGWPGPARSRPAPRPATSCAT